MIGQTISHYRIVEHLGSGGMGVVYRAEDLRLGRDVALKFLPPELSGDAAAVERLRREARAASALNHPHICTIYDVDEQGGQHFIVMELLEGQTLRDVMASGRLETVRTVEYAVQISDALDAAHNHGIVHRDLKPANIFVTRRRDVKVVDFGLAKHAGGAKAGEPSGRTATDHLMTVPGTRLGTVAYMSPEQARGEPVDARSDLFSFGTVLYEMATGSLPFGGATTAVLFDALLNRAPPAVDGLNPELPAGLVQVINKALEKDRNLRYQSAGEVRTDLERVKREPHVRAAATAQREAEPEVPASTRAVRRSRVLLPTVAAAAIGVAAIVTSSRMDRTAQVIHPQVSLAVLPFDNVDAGHGADYLRIGLADEVATALGYASSIVVRPLASSRRYAGAGVTPQQAGRELRATSVVTGHFSRGASDLRVTLEAIDVEDNRVVWRETVAAPEADAIALREQLTTRVRNGLLPALGAGAPVASRDRPRNPDAYAQYLKSLSMSREPAPNREAIALLERVTSLDPEYASGWAALGIRYYYDGQYGTGTEAMHRAEAAARQTLALDPNHVQAALGLLHLQIEVGRLTDAYGPSAKLLQQRPDSAEAHFSFSLLLRYAGLIDEAASACETAMALDPVSNSIRSCFIPFMLLGRYDRAFDFIRTDAGSTWAAGAGRRVYLRMGRRREAREELDRTAVKPVASRLSRCLDGAPPAVQGAVSDRELAELLARPDPERLYFTASDLAYCGHTKPALRLLDEAVRRNYCAYPAAETDPTFASVRGTAEFAQILQAGRACRERFEAHAGAQRR